MTVKSDEYRCEAYVILSFHRAVRWVPPALAVGRKPHLLSREHTAITRVMAVY